MSDNKVKVFRSGEGSTKTTQTTGMHREELVSTPNAWVGMVQTQPEFTSGWHHHGDYDTYVYVISGEIKLEFGEGGKDSVVAKVGEVAFIPKDTVHREVKSEYSETIVVWSEGRTRRSCFQCRWSQRIKVPKTLCKRSIQKRFDAYNASTHTRIPGISLTLLVGRR